jgi:hypothetical protein
LAVNETIARMVWPTPLPISYEPFRLSKICIFTSTISRPSISYYLNCPSTAAMVDTPPNTGSLKIPNVDDMKPKVDTKLPEIHDRSISANYDPHIIGTPLPHYERPFKFIFTWRFWGILILGQILSWCIVSTNTLTEYLFFAGAIIPAFQTLFNYALLNLVYTSWTLYKYGFKKWTQLLWKDGWKYFILAFADVQGVRIPSYLFLTE